MMKRIFAILLVLSMLFSLAACGGDPEPTEKVPGATKPVQTEAPTEEPTEAPTEPPAYTADNWNLVDNENVVFTVTEFRHNEHLGLEMHVYCENKTDKNMMFSLDGVSVLGVMYDPFWAEEVAAGKKANSTIYFDTFELAEMGIDSVDEISFRLSVMDNDNWMDEPFVDEVFTVYPTGKTAETVVYPQYRHKNGETVIVDGDLLFIVEKVDDVDSSRYVLNCYIANRTDKNLLVSWDGVSVNGFMVNPYWSVSIASGKQAYSEIIFFRSELDKQDIEVVQDITFRLQASNSTDWSEDYLFDEIFTFNPNH